MPKKKADRLYNRKSARKAVFHTVFYRGISQAATVLGYVVMVRAMTEEDFGIFNLMYAFMPVVSTLLSLGLEQTLRRYQPQYLGGGNLYAAATLTRVVSLARFGANAAMLIGILALWDWVAPVFKIAPYKGEFAIFCGIVLLYFQTRILQLSLASHMLHRYSVGMLALLSVTKLLAYMAIAWIGELTLTAAIYADLGAFLLMYLGLTAAHRYHCSVPEPTAGAAFTSEERQRMIRYGLLSNFNDAGTLALNVRSDNFFVAALMDTRSVGAYAFYVRLSLMVTRLLPTRMFEDVLKPMFFSIAPADSATRVPRYFSMLLNMSLIFQIPITAYVLVYHDTIVNVLFAGKFGDVSWLMPVIFGFSAIGIAEFPVTVVAQYQERPKVLLYSKFFGIYSIGAMFLLIPYLGLYGAALATGSAQVLKTIFVWWHVRALARWQNSGDHLLSAVAIWGTAVGFGYALKLWLPLPEIILLALSVCIFAAAALLYVRSAALSHSDREILGSLFHGRESRWLQLLGIGEAGKAHD